MEKSVIQSEKRAALASLVVLAFSKKSVADQNYEFHTNGWTEADNQAPILPIPFLLGAHYSAIVNSEPVCMNIHLELC
ncbi:MAG: hypothetical protein GC154_16395 [bacterium]|nr:hypothetical protein [bacterium]